MRIDIFFKLIFSMFFIAHSILATDPLQGPQSLKRRREEVLPDWSPKNKKPKIDIKNNLPVNDPEIADQVRDKIFSPIERPNFKLNSIDSINILFPTKFFDVAKFTAGDTMPTADEVDLLKMKDLRTLIGHALKQTENSMQVLFPNPNYEENLKPKSIGAGQFHIVYTDPSDRNYIIKIMNNMANNNAQIESTFRNIKSYYHYIQRENDLNIYVARIVNNFFKDGFYKYERFDNKFDLNDEGDKKIICDKLFEIIVDNKYISDFKPDNVRKRGDSKIVIIDVGPIWENKFDMVSDILNCLSQWMEGHPQCEKDFLQRLENSDNERAKKILDQYQSKN